MRPIHTLRTFLTFHTLPTLRTFLTFLTFLTLLGCDSNPLRFAPTESQKRIAYTTFLNATAVDSDGTTAGSPAARQILDGSQVALRYTGMPKTPAKVSAADYPDISAAATASATRRPDTSDVFDAAEGGLSLAAELAILFGVGGTALGGKKIIDLIKIAKAKSIALREIVENNETFLTATAPKIDMTKEFKAAQSSQSPATQTLVHAIKHKTV